MSVRSRVALFAAVCAVGLCGFVRSASADDNQPKQTVEGAPAPAPQAPAAETPPPKPLMSLIDQSGWLSNAGINVYGFVEGGYTYNVGGPAGNINAGRVFDNTHEDLTLHQADLTIQRTVDPTKKSPDIGFTVETIYGADARYIHSNGLDFYGPGDAARGAQLDPENQVDLVQAYVDLAVAQGWMIRAGKFGTHMGYETINPTTNPLYSHSYAFGYAIPFTHTGLEAYWNATDKMTIMFGATRGWEEALKDDNSVFDYVGQIKYVFSDKVTGYINFTAGPEKTTNNDDTRIVLDGILTYAVNDKLSFAVNGDFGWEERADDTGGGSALWYGITGYAGYKICDMFTFNARAEFFNDQDAARGLGTTVYEGTLGLTITPLPNDKIGSNFKLRPELRYDYAEKEIFDGGTNANQITLGIDAIFTF